MKKIKNIFIFSSILVCFFMGLNIVNAKTYVSYRKNSKIQVNVNDHEKIDFYVINDSDSTKSTVKAIMSDTSYPYMYVYSEAILGLKQYEIDWSNVIGITLPSAEEILGIDSKLFSSIDFQAPRFAWNTTSNYWVSDKRISDSKEEIPFLIEIVKSQNKGIFRESTILDLAAMRPVITVSKDYIEGGTLEVNPLDLITDKRYKQFLENFSNGIKDIDFQLTMDIKSDYLKIFTTDYDENSYVTEFKYKDGILTYVENDKTSNEMQMSIDYAYQLVALNSFLELDMVKGNDIDLKKLLNDTEKFTIEKDGLEIKTNKFVFDNGTIEACTSLKLDIKNGFKSLNSYLKEENPKTGYFGTTIGIGLIVVVGISIIYIKSKKYSKFQKSI